MRKTIITMLAAVVVSTSTLADDTKTDAIYKAVHENSFRLEEEKARDQYRHPEALLRFSGVTPSSITIEVNPGGGWYSRIIAPLVKDKGRYIALEANPERYSGNYAKNLKAYAEKITSNPALYGEKAIASWFETAPSAIEAASVDVAFAIRTIHNFASRGFLDTGLADLHAALKVGGHLVVVQHRANENSDKEVGELLDYGRFKQSDLIAKIEARGFKLVASDEMNANANDPQDISVWLLPPSLSGADKNNGKYRDVGESDRMTLKFIKLGTQ